MPAKCMSSFSFRFHSSMNCACIKPRTPKTDPTCAFSRLNNVQSGAAISWYGPSVLKHRVSSDFWATLYMIHFSAANFGVSSLYWIPGHLAHWQTTSWNDRYRQHSNSQQSASASQHTPPCSCKVTLKPRPCNRLASYCVRNENFKQITH